MNISALLTSAGINTAVSLALFSLYSVLRKQPSLLSVYFGHKLAQAHSKNQDDPFWYWRLVPSASWIMKAWEASEEELYAAGGVDAVVFLRAVVFSIRVFTIAASVCLFLVLPLNYFGQQMEHKQIPAEQLSVFTIDNVKEGSKSLWAHCLALYIISFCACILLYIEYKSITRMRIAHISSALSSPAHFAIVVRGIPWVPEESYSDTVTKFFTDFYSSSYFSHQMVYDSGAIQKLMNDAEKVYKMLKSTYPENCIPRATRCCICGGNAPPFKMLSQEHTVSTSQSCFDGANVREKECSAAVVFFRTRYAALIAAEALQSLNLMLWVTESAPEPSDMFWSNLCVPYKLFWIRRLAVSVASMFCVIFFLFPVVFAQSLVHLDKIKKIFPFMNNIAQRKIVEQLLTGYLPSVIFTVFLFFVPPLMMVFSTLEGVISRSGRKRSTCIKVVVFIIWNVFFANILTEAAIDHYQVSIMKLGDYRNIPSLLAKAVPATATFFMTYVLTSGWASLSYELIQPFPLLYNLFWRYILQRKEETLYSAYTFPYHTEVPRVLLFGLLGFTCSTLAPLILPLLLVYFVLAYLVYRNQLLNVYITEYDSGGLYWPIVHNATMFSLVLTQIIALGVFGIKQSPVASGFTFPLLICTLLFHEYCRQRFHPVFHRTPVQIVIEMDRNRDSGMEEMQQKLQSAYCQFSSTPLSCHRTTEQTDSVFARAEKDDVAQLEDLIQSS